MEINGLWLRHSGNKYGFDGLTRKIGKEIKNSDVLAVQLDLVRKKDALENFYLDIYL